MLVSRSAAADLVDGEDSPKPPDGGCQESLGMGAMSWWVWLVVIVMVAAVVVVGVWAVQVRRRRGGVIVDPTHSPRTRGRKAGR